MRRPYENENPMRVMGHHHGWAQEKPGKVGWQVSPALVYHLAERGKGHPTIHDLNPAHTPGHGCKS
jgi:hypothetical protein